jgi:diguanylate cyclase (GGDEF)-like protein
MFLLRPLQGLVPGFDFDGLLVADTLMKANLLVGLICVVSSGAFSLSLAYERSAAALREMAFSDALTGLANRRAFERRFAEAVASRSASRGVALAMLDVDHFKSINDQYGHAAGDEALRVCAAAIRGAAGRWGFAARVGGEEFAVLMTDVSAADARRLADILRDAVARTPVRLGHRTVTVTVSVGLHHRAGGCASFDRAMQEADRCLYDAKTRGRNRVECAAV